MSPRRTNSWPVIWLVLFGVFLVTFVGCRGGASRAPRAVDGVLDLRTWDFDEDGPVDLAGQWELVWGELLEPDTFDEHDKLLYDVPGSWNELEIDGQPAGRQGVASARLRVLLPSERPSMLIRSRGISTAHRLWINGHERDGAGVISADLDSLAPASANRLHQVPDGANSVEILTQVANRDHREGGLRKAWLLGAHDEVSHHHVGWLLYETVTMTAMAVVCCYFLLFYAVRRTGISRLYFALFTLIYALRASVSGDAMPLTVMYPDLSWAARIAIEYASSWAATGLGLATVVTLYPQEDHRPVTRVLLGVCAVGTVYTLLTPPSVFMASLELMQLVAAVVMLWILVVLARAHRSRREGAAGLLIAIVVFLIALLHDIALAQGLIDTPFELTQPAFVGVVLMEAAQLARSFAQSYTVIEQLSKDLTLTNRDLEATNKAVERFVPYEFLNLLDRSSIRDVDRGDNTWQIMDVLFCDLRSFTTIVESLDPKQAFAFINDYLSYMEPQIRKHKGFVNSYLGDAYLALYYGGGDETLRSAIAMMHSLEQFNANQQHVPDMEIHVGIGIHSGALMLGTIGGLDRLDSGVVGDPVNLASRVEGMTKMYGTPLLISEATYARVQNKQAFHIRELDQVVAKGKTEAIRLYEVLDGLPKAQAERKWSTREAFAAALEAYRAGHFEQACAAFRSHLDEVPEDAPARLYVERCETYLVAPPAHWDGVTVLTKK